MSKVICDKEDLVAVANAVRTQTGSSEGMTLGEIASGVYSISGGSVEVVQTTGNSTTSVMSQKAVTDAINQISEEIADQNSRIEQAVANEKGNIVQLLIDELHGLPVFGVVDENKVITVTSILYDGTYTLKYENEDGSTTDIGTVVVGTGTGGGSGGDEPVVAINLADTTSAEWKTNKRINSSKNEVDIPSNSLNGETMVITNLIDITGITNSTEYHIKGLNLLATTGVGASYNRVYFYDESKAYKMYWQPSGAYVSHYMNVSSYDENVQIFSNIQQLISGISELSGVTVQYISFGAVLTGTAADVFITKDTQIV